MSGDMVAGPGAVHTLRTRLAAAVPVKPRRADCRRESVEGEKRGSVDNVWCNKRYIILLQAITRVII